MHDDGLETSEEIEEVRELLYNLLKNFQTGVTSTFLEEQYNRKYVETGMTRPLPANWLEYVKQAEEFEVKQLSTFTMLYLVNTDFLLTSSIPVPFDKVSKNTITPPSSPLDEKFCLETAVKSVVESLQSPTLLTDGDGEVESKQNSVDLEPMPLLSMPTGVTVQAHVVLAIDPDNIIIRLCSWDPVPDYLYSALMRVSDSEPRPPSKIINGQTLAAPIHGVWERVRVIRKSRFPNCYIVLAVDVGFYHIVRADDLRPLSEAALAFKKIFAAKIKLSGIRPLSDSIISTPPVMNRVTDSGVSPPQPPLPPSKDASISLRYWSREVQLAIADLLEKSDESGRNRLVVELTPTADWCYDDGEETTCLGIPRTEGRLSVNGVGVAESLISMGVVEKDV